MKTTSEYIYRTLLRPPGPGAVPREGLVRTDYVESWFGNRHYWGHAVYNRKLKKEELEHYDMEWARTVITEKPDGDTDA